MVNGKKPCTIIISQYENLVDLSISCHDKIRNAVEFITHYYYQVVLRPPRLISKLKLQNNNHFQIHVYTIESVFIVIHHGCFVTGCLAYVRCIT